MKAILEGCNGLLKGEMEIKEPKMEIYIQCPQKLRLYNYTEAEYGEIPQRNYMMVFEYKKQLNPETILYEFTEIK